MKGANQLIQLCRTIQKNNFDAKKFIFEFQNNYCILSVINRGHTVIMKIGITDNHYHNTKEQSTVKLELTKESYEFSKISKHDKDFLKSLNMWDNQIYFHDQDFIPLGNAHIYFLKHIETSREDLLFRIKDKEVVYKAQWFEESIITIPTCIQVKLLENNILCMRYDYYDFDVRLIVAATITEPNIYEQKLIEVV